MLATLRRHWLEYLIEGTCVGLAMLALGTCILILFHPQSILVQVLPSPAARRGLLGLLMAATSLSLVYSPFGRRSGAHFNPAVTLTFFRLGRTAGQDAAWYVLAQVVGAMTAFGLIHTLTPSGWLSAPQIHELTSMPAALGAGVAWAAEFLIDFLLMLVILTALGSPRWRRRTGWLVAVLVALNASLWNPLLGTSMNPARTFGAAVWAGAWRSLWIYLTAAPLGMLVAAQTFQWRFGPRAWQCAKLDHDDRVRCIFCEWKGERALSGKELGVSQ